MLIALLTIMLLGGTPTAMLEEISRVEDSVKLVMPKTDQRKAALDTLKRIGKRTNSHNKQVDKTLKQLQNALSAHGVADSVLDEMWDEYHAARGNYQKDMIDLRFELKEQVSREEWEEIFSGG